MRRRRILWLAVPLLAADVRSSLLGRPRPDLLGDPQWRPTAVEPPDATARVWITDGSLPVYSDTTHLLTTHPVLAGMRTPYEGFIDPAVARGSLELARDDAEDVLFVEGKWMNRLLGTRAWVPASIGNNVLAVGPGIRTTLGSLEDDLGAQVRIEYESTRSGLREQVSRSADLGGHSLRGLVEEVIALGEPLDAINLGALGQ